MLSPPTAPRIPVYNFTVPTEADAVAALQRVWGPERGESCWFNACRSAGLPVGRIANVNDLERATAELARQGGATATVARSIEIRLRTYARLAAKTAASSTGARP
jgi:hypothetical protein